MKAIVLSGDGSASPSSVRVRRECVPSAAADAAVPGALAIVTRWRTENDPPTNYATNDKH